MTPDPFAALVALAEAECALVAAGRFDELPALDAEWRERLAALPGPATLTERSALERALPPPAEAAAGPRAALAETARELAELDGTRAGMRGYAPPPAAP